jgi:antitoxin ParD1/3/4
MQVELTPEVQKLIDGLVAGGRFSTPTEAVNTALRLFLDPPEAHRRADELKALIQEGIESADRGELLDLDEVCDEVLREIGQVAARSQ